MEKCTVYEDLMEAERKGIVHVIGIDWAEDAVKQADSMDKVRELQCGLMKSYGLESGYPIVIRGIHG